MSKLVKAITAVDTRAIVRYPEYATVSDKLFMDTVSVDEKFTNYRVDNLTVYEIRVTVGNTVAVTGAEVGNAVENTKRAVIESVFGEFRSYFRRVNQAAYERNWKGIQDIMDEFEQQMYGDA